MQNTNQKVIHLLNSNDQGHTPVLIDVDAYYGSGGNQGIFPSDPCITSLMQGAKFLWIIWNEKKSQQRSNFFTWLLHK